MRTFVDLNTARIHQYLGRSNRLKLIRGASTLLAEVSSENAVNHWLAETWPSGAVSICAEAGQAESVIHLEIDSGPDVPVVEPADVAKAGLERLRELVPAADFRADWGTGESYSDFVKSPQGRLELFATTPELTMLTQCDECRRGHAGTNGLCLDCSQRNLHGGLDEDAGPARRLVRMLTAQRGDTLRIAENFDSLARLGPICITSRETTEATDIRTVRPRKNNHLATVYIDGNGFRAMFSGAGRHAAPDGFDVGELSRGIGEATWAAMEEATDAVLAQHDWLMPFQDDPIRRHRHLPVIPHVVAADDVCVSLPASYAWTFAVTFCNSFAAATRQIVAEAGEGWDPNDPGCELFDTVPPATASASIVVANSSEPFWFTLELAEELLSQAKRVVSGKEPMIMWAEVTRDGEHVPASRQPMRLSSLPSEALDELSLLNRTSQRNLLADVTTGDGTEDDRFRNRIQRTGVGDGRPALKSLIGDPGFDHLRLRDLLSIADWWTPWKR